MKLETAIETLTQQVWYYHQVHQVDIIDALKLGIEALEFYKREKDANVSGIWTLLPGETGQEKE